MRVVEDRQILRMPPYVYAGKDWPKSAPVGLVKPANGSHGSQPAVEETLSCASTKKKATA